MKRILFVIGEMNLGGAESFIMKMYRALNKEKFQFDFVINKDGYYSEEILSLGGKLFYTELKSKHFFKALRQLKRIVHEYKYLDVIRFGTSTTSYFDLLAAKSGGAIHLGVRTLSTNQGNFIKKFISFMLRPFLNSIATIKFAPSLNAAKATFGRNAKRVFILNNGINYSEYSYSEGARQSIRKDLNISDNSIVFGHVGRMSKEKNHSFLIHTFYEYHKFNQNSYLIMVGDGPLMDELKALVKELAIKNYVYFLGKRSDVPLIYSCFDYFLFPSFYEGMPNSLIEAQANGLTCFYSDKITNECEMSSNIFRLELKQQIWLDKIKNTKTSRTNNYKTFKDKSYLIEETVKEFITKLTDSKY